MRDSCESEIVKKSYAGARAFDPKQSIGYCRGGRGGGKAEVSNERFSAKVKQSALKHGQRTFLRQLFTQRFLTFDASGA